MAKLKEEIAFAKAKAAGAVYRDNAAHPVIPETALDELPSSAVALGYVGPEGIENNEDVSEEEFQDMNGDTVATIITSRKEVVSFTLLQTSPETLAAIYGDVNVTDTGTEIVVVRKATEQKLTPWYIELVLTGDRVLRKVIPAAKPKAGRTITYKKGKPIDYTLELTCMPDDNGVTSLDYYAKAVIDEG